MLNTTLSEDSYRLDCNCDCEKACGLILTNFGSDFILDPLKSWMSAGQKWCLERLSVKQTAV
jgi:hypothetical protein